MRIREEIEIQVAELINKTKRSKSHETASLFEPT